MNRNARAFAILMIASDVSQKLRSALEFAVVIGIIMVLIALAIRNFEIYVVQSQITEAFWLTSTVKGDMVTYRAQHGYWPIQEPDLRNSTISQAQNLGRFVDHLELTEGGAISAVFNDEKSAAALQGRRLTFRPMVVSSDHGSPLLWSCGAHIVPDGFVPGGIDETDIEHSQLPSACRNY